MWNSRIWCFNAVLRSQTSPFNLTLIPLEAICLEAKRHVLYQEKNRGGLQSLCVECLQLVVHGVITVCTGPSVGMVPGCYSLSSQSCRHKHRLLLLWTWWGLDDDQICRDLMATGAGRDRASYVFQERFSLWKFQHGHCWSCCCVGPVSHTLAFCTCTCCSQMSWSTQIG